MQHGGDDDDDGDGDGDGRGGGVLPAPWQNLDQNIGIAWWIMILCDINIHLAWLGLLLPLNCYLFCAFARRSWSDSAARAPSPLRSTHTSIQIDSEDLPRSPKPNGTKLTMHISKPCKELGALGPHNPSKLTFANQYVIYVVTIVQLCRSWASAVSSHPYLIKHTKLLDIHLLMYRRNVIPEREDQVTI